MEQIKGLAGLGDGEKKIEMRREGNRLIIGDSPEGKRGNVLAAAVNYYYDQACRIAQGMLAAEAYRKSGKMKV